MFRRFSLIALLLATASCSGGASDGHEGSGSKGDSILVSDPGPDDAPPTDDPCANVRLAGPDGVCDFDGPYVECDADCLPDEPPVTDACSLVFIIPDGQCDPTSTLAECDPDCNGTAEPPGDCDPPEVPPQPEYPDDPCAAIDIYPDGQCDPEASYAACDPDCSIK